jgi:hypothetical protein
MSAVHNEGVNPQVIYKPTTKSLYFLSYPSLSTFLPRRLSHFLSLRSRFSSLLICLSSRFLSRLSRREPERQEEEELEDEDEIDEDRDVRLRRGAICSICGSMLGTGPRLSTLS